MPSWLLKQLVGITPAVHAEDAIHALTHEAAPAIIGAANAYLDSQKPELIFGIISEAERLGLPASAVYELENTIGERLGGFTVPTPALRDLTGEFTRTDLASHTENLVGLITGEKEQNMSGSGSSGASALPFGQGQGVNV